LVSTETMIEMMAFLYCFNPEPEFNNQPDIEISRAAQVVIEATPNDLAGDNCYIIIIEPTS